MSESLQKYVDLLGKSQICRSTDISTETFAEALIAIGILTRWQSDKLIDGKYKGFELDNYLLLDHHHTDDNRAYYVANDLTANCRVILAVQPKSRNEPDDDSVHYEVLPFEGI